MDIEKSIEENMLTVRINGRIDIETAPDFDRTVTETIDRNLLVILDFTNLSYISSAGLRSLLHLRNAVDEYGGDIRIVNVIDEVMEIFNVTGFVDMFEFGE
ncbi:MAG: STAS domain-containing protein [Ruminococcus sp.]|nr:STAS domain-containing protein [Ruminococcus sp.]